MIHKVQVFFTEPIYFITYNIYSEEFVKYTEYVKWVKKKIMQKTPNSLQCNRFFEMTKLKLRGK